MSNKPPILHPIQRIEALDPRLLELVRQTNIKLILWIIFSISSWFLMGEISILLSLVVLGFMIIRLQVEIYRRTKDKNYQHYRQLEAHINLLNLIKLNHPLPPMRLWAISPDVATVLFSQIKSHRPNVILELGSGISTLISAYSAQQANLDVQVYTIEHEKEYAQKTQHYIEAHGFNKNINTLHAPLQPISINEFSGKWYATDIFSQINSVDLLFIDGPPGKLQPLSRYPALPILYDKLNEGAIIILDDYAREDEFKVVQRWLKDFDLEIVEIIDNEKGAIILKKCTSQ